MAIITKCAPILAEESFIDMLPVAWELLLESDQELAASAGRYPHSIAKITIKFLILIVIKMMIPYSIQIPHELR